MILKIGFWEGTQLSTSKPVLLFGQRMIATVFPFTTIFLIMIGCERIHAQAAKSNYGGQTVALYIASLCRAFRSLRIKLFSVKSLIGPRTK